ncbi:MAG: hypothetical protein N2Z22_08620 [Turneriella sp.]|nr:hypothetical protein [Turneriella sp.]
MNVVFEMIAQNGCGVFMRFWLVAAVMAVAFSCKRTKREFIPFNAEKKYVVVPLVKSGKIELLKKPEYDVDKIQSAAKELPATGLWIITRKVDDNYQERRYLQVQCPPELKCKNNEAYIAPRVHLNFSDKNTLGADVIVDEDEDFILTTSDKVEQIRSFQAWLLDPKLSEFNPIMDLALIFKTLLAAKRNLENEIIDLWFFAKFVLLLTEQHASSNQVLVSHKLIQKFNLLKTIHSTQKPQHSEESQQNTAGESTAVSLNKAQKEFLQWLAKELSEKASSHLISQATDFPFQHTKIKEQEKAFNNLTEPVFVKTMVAKEILEDVPFFVEMKSAAQPTETAVPPTEQATPPAQPAPIKLEIEFSNALKIHFKLNGKDYDIVANDDNISAVTHKNGLKLIVNKGTPEEVTFEPAEKVIYLHIGSDEGFKQLVSGLPPVGEQVKELPLDLALAFIALKSNSPFEREVDSGKVRISYVIDLSEGKNFWRVLDAHKAFLGEKSSNVYASKDSIWPNDKFKYPIHWKQYYVKSEKHAYFVISYTEKILPKFNIDDYPDCGDIDVCIKEKIKDEEREAVCLDNKKSLQLKMAPHTVNILKAVLQNQMPIQEYKRDYKYKFEELVAVFYHEEVCGEVFSY